MKRKSLLGMLLVLVIAMAYPIESTIVPTWKLRVVDEQGKPYSGIFVRQSWKHYSLESDASNNEDDKWTNDDGYVEFPERKIRASLFRRIVLTIWAFVGTFTHHGSTGIRADISVWDKDNYPKSVRYIPNEPLPTEIILKR